MTEHAIIPIVENPPVTFTQAEIGWTPWLQPLPEEKLTERHLKGLVEAGRAKSPYFRLLVRDPEVLEARTKTDKDIFYNTRSACRAPSANWRRPPRLDITAASSAPQYIRASLRITQSAQRMCRSSSTRASEPISANAGMQSSPLLWR